MKKVLLFVLLLTSFVGYTQEPNYVRNEILVQLKDNVKGAQIASEMTTLTVLKAELVSRPLNIWLLSIAPSQNTEEIYINFLQRNPNVLVAQKNHKVKTRATTPDDAQYDSQWQYFQENDKDIDADDAWDITTGGTTLNGDVIVAAALDDGHDTDHEDFGDNLWINEAEIPDNGIDDDDNNYVDDYLGWSIVTDDDNIEGGGHGTPVAGIMGAQGNNEIGVSGVNWDVKLMIIKNNFNTNEAAVIEAYSYALEARILYNETNGEEGAFVVSTNASWGVDFGDPEDAPLWCALYDTLGENGILSCGATINANQNVDVIGDLPTACPSEYMIAVTNTNINDVKVTNAGYGFETIDLGAPGAGAFTTAANNGYGGFGGTSGATPHVTGTIALLYSAPCQELADLANESPEIAAQVVRDLILENVDPNPSLKGITTTGGRLNVNNAMQALMENCGNLLSTNTTSPLINTVSIYPNPSSGLITIANSSNLSLDTVKIYSLDGRLINEISEFSDASFNIGNLAKGAYLFSVTFKESNVSYNKMVVKE